MKRIFFWATLAAGVAAAILMYRRGETLGNIARKSFRHPVGSLASELKASFGQRQLATSSQ